LVGAQGDTIRGDVDADPLLTTLGAFETAGESDLAVVPHRASPLQIRACQAGVLVGDGTQQVSWSARRGIFLRAKDPSHALLAILEGPCRPSEVGEWLSEEETVRRFGPQARTAMVHSLATIGEEAWIGPGAVVHARVVIASGSRIGENSVLGSDGFGLVDVDGRQVQMPHWAGVVIESDVQIGPQCQISAGLLDPTSIGRGARLDAQIQVGHNCRIGPGCVLAGQSGLAGSVTLGERCLVGGRAAISDHVVLGDGCQVGGGSIVLRSWPAGSRLAGFPATSVERWRRGLRPHPGATL
jgi:acetyltransferase-like isoleucine patch superfamily enzyme